MAKAKYEIKFKPEAFTAIRNGDRVCSALTTVAGQIAASANAMGSGSTAYQSDAGRPGKKRAHALVWTGNVRAIYDNAANNTLLKALKGRAR